MQSKVGATPGALSPSRSNGTVVDPMALAAFQELYSRSSGKGAIFIGVRGQVHKPRHWFEKAVREAGVANFTWHDLRHTFASRLVMMGVDLRTVQELMGHKTMAMTCRYSHLSPEHTQAAVDRLQNFGTQAGPTDTKTDTAPKAAVMAESGIVN